MRKICCSLNTRAHDAVDLLRAGQVVAERLLEHDADVAAVQAGGAELLADLREEVRAGRQVQHDRVGAALVAASPSGRA